MAAKKGTLNPNARLSSESTSCGSAMPSATIKRRSRPNNDCDQADRLPADVVRVQAVLLGLLVIQRGNVGAGVWVWHDLHRHSLRRHVVVRVDEAFLVLEDLKHFTRRVAGAVRRQHDVRRDDCIEFAEDFDLQIEDLGHCRRESSRVRACVLVQ